MKQLFGQLLLCLLFFNSGAQTVSRPAVVKESNHFSLFQKHDVLKKYTEKEYRQALKKTPLDSAWAYRFFENTPVVQPFNDGYRVISPQVFPLTIHEIEDTYLLTVLTKVHPQDFDDVNLFAVLVDKTGKQLHGVEWLGECGQEGECNMSTSFEIYNTMVMTSYTTKCYDKYNEITRKAYEETTQKDKKIIVIDKTFMTESDETTKTQEIK